MQNGTNITQQWKDNSLKYYRTILHTLSSAAIFCYMLDVETIP
jgi:hypothetical protein